jgi:UDP-2-acetamido-2,6-beta-L-arabino-hexul-4-ose reductase
MRVLVTGANGFIGKNLTAHLNDQEQFSVLVFNRENSLCELEGLIKKADAVVHLAGENRPLDVTKFETINVGLTESICEAIRFSQKKIPLIFASSVQAEHSNLYGESKLAAEKAVRSLANEIGNAVYIYRLPGVFGKWCKQNYNSVVATFCFNISHNIPIKIEDKSTLLRLVYIDDLVLNFIHTIQQDSCEIQTIEIKPEYSITVGELADQIATFQNCRTNLSLEKVGSGLTRALYSTYMSYLSPEQFSYALPIYNDKRGSFVEIIKTLNHGQFSYFTAHSGVTRGGHYHHTKSEKFLVVKGKACFRFKQVDTGQSFEIITSSDEPKIVDTIPGWAHEITNIGSEEMVVFLWANEIFNKELPDTILSKV